MSGFLYVATLVAALGCALAGGGLLPFSNFAMAGLRRLPTAQGIAAMQAINITVVNPLFMTILFGPGPVFLALIALHALFSDRLATILVISGGVLYIVGVVVVTMFRNVPLNNMLAALNPQNTGAADRWNEYFTKWTVWNHVRVIAALVAATLLIIALGLQ